MSFYLQDNPNPNTPQYGWERAPLGAPGVHLSGVIGVHTSEAITDFEGVDNNAENNAAFLGRRTDYGSYHTTADADSIVPLVHPRYATWADTTNNPHAMSVSGCLQAARWLEMTPERRRAVVVNMAHAAALMVQTAVADGYLASPTPAVRISATEAIAGSSPGFYGHGETNPGTRYDPGSHFDWDLFLSAYAEAIGGGITFQSAPQEELDMAAVDKIYEFTTTLFAQYHKASIDKIYSFTTTLFKQYHEASINETRSALRDSFKAYAEANAGPIDAEQLALQVAKKFDAILDAGIKSVDVPDSIDVEPVDVTVEGAK
jgi:hypothetical protein